MNNLGKPCLTAEKRYIKHSHKHVVYSVYVFKCSLVTPDYSSPHQQNIWSGIFLTLKPLGQAGIFISKAAETFVYHLIGHAVRLSCWRSFLMTCLMGLNGVCSPAFTFTINNSTVPIWNVFYNCVITHLIYPIVKPRVWLNINNCLVLLVSLVGKQPCNLR